MKKFFIPLFLVLWLAGGVWAVNAEEQKTAAAVLDLEAKEGISQGVASTISDYLRIQLVNTDKFAIITRENMESVLKEQQFQLSGAVDQAKIVEIGKLLGVQKMFTGSVGKVGDIYLVNLKIVDVQSGKIEKAETEECADCKEEGLLGSIKAAVNRIAGLKAGYDRSGIAQTAGSQKKEGWLGVSMGSIDDKTVKQLNLPGKTGALILEVFSSSPAEKAGLEPNDVVIGFGGRPIASYPELVSAVEMKTPGEKVEARVIHYGYERTLNIIIGDKEDGKKVRMEHYTKAIEKDPGDSLSYYNRGREYFNRDDYMRAEKDFGKAIELSPKTDYFYNMRGYTYLRLRLYKDALNDFTKAIEVNPKYSTAFIYRGHTYILLGNMESAVNDFSKAIAFDPKNYLGFYNRGIVKNQLKRYSDAINDFNKAIELNPNNANIYLDKGNSYYYQGDYNSAIREFSKAVEVKPQYADAYYNRGNTYKAQGQNKNAVDDYNAALRINPEFANACFNLGVVYEKSKMASVACDNYFQAGLLYLKQGDKTRALNCMDAMKRVDARSPLISKLYDKIYSSK